MTSHLKLKNKLKTAKTEVYFNIRENKKENPTEVKTLNLRPGKSRGEKGEQENGTYTCLSVLTDERGKEGGNLIPPSSLVRLKPGDLEVRHGGGNF